MNTNESASFVESESRFQLAATLLQQPCCEDACGCTANTTFDQQSFCLNHFLLRCSETLAVLDPRAGRFHDGPVHLAAMRAFLQECSRKTLELSMHHEDISKNQRARLMDILLWAGELYPLLNAPRKWTLPGFIAQQELPSFG